MAPRASVVGLGNVLMGDDAFGPTVVRTLEARWSFPPAVEVQDLGTPGLDLHPHFQGRDLIVLVDTVRSDGPPGTVRTYDKADLLRAPVRARTSPHDPGVQETLQALEFVGGAPAEVVLVGVVPGEIGYEVGLTPEVRDALVDVEARVIAILRERGFEARRRAGADEARVDLWWEAPIGPTTYPPS